MADERYAPPQAQVRDVAHERTLAQRPRQIVMAAAAIALSWLLDLPAAYGMHSVGAQAGLLVVAEAVSLVVLGLMCMALLRGRGWIRHLYALVTLGLLAFSLSAAPEPVLPGYVEAATWASTLCALAALPLLYFGPGARWYRELREA